MKHLPGRLLPLVLGCVILIGMLGGCKASNDGAAQATATSNAIQITLMNAVLGVNVPLGVRVENTGKANLYAITGKAACTIVQLQRYQSDKKTWVAADRCQSNVAPHVLVIYPGLSEPFTLAPTSASDPNTWDKGTYRVAVTFSTAGDGTTNAEVAYSRAFAISGS